MRLWSISPKYLDRMGLLAVWRESLLAKKVLEGKTLGYRNHPQLIRFRESIDPLVYINTYLYYLNEEALARTYNFDKTKFTLFDFPTKNITVTDGQVQFELTHLRNKLSLRSPQLVQTLPQDSVHTKVVPIFTIVKGEIENWEIQE